MKVVKIKSESDFGPPIPTDSFERRVKKFVEKIKRSYPNNWIPLSRYLCKKRHLSISTSRAIEIIIYSGERSLLINLRNHVWQNTPLIEIYNSFPFDPDWRYTLCSKTRYELDCSLVDPMFFIPDAVDSGFTCLQANPTDLVKYVGKEPIYYWE